MFGVQEIINAQNFEKIQFYEALKVLEKVEKTPKSPVIAIIDGAVRKELFSETVFWTNIHEIPNNNIDDDGNGYVDDYEGWNFSNDTNDVINNGLGDWHGTPVFSLVNRLVSSAQKIKLMNLVKGDKIDEVLESLRYVLSMRKKYNETGGKEGAFIVAVNCSWGKNMLWAADFPEWCSIYNELGEQGVLVVSSVPNNNINVDEVGDMPSTCRSEYLLTVTNVNKLDEKVVEAAYGSYSVDIAAPGDRSVTLLNSGEYGVFGGTSAAAPYVSGTIGLLYTVFIEQFQNDIIERPQETALLIKQLILEGSDKSVSLENIITSEGRLNVFKSVKLLLDEYGENEKYEAVFSDLNIQKIYPNPVKNNCKLLIESDRSEEVSISIIDINGLIVETFSDFTIKGIKEVLINLADFQLSRGIYFLQVRNESNLYDTTKMIVK
ncbi:S8 family serine peptidase [Tenacibaculum amylolyticum]|uniref:S8 family serine peptidase n=1 Tax=Tenacibaculum amylolyticum TaxID=104269 RepID=UPI0038B4E0EF